MAESFLEAMAGTDRFVQEEFIETSGPECHQRIMADVAREMLASGENFDDPVSEWSVRSTARWRETKFFKLYQEELQAGRNPNDAFEQRGWEP